MLDDDTFVKDMLAWKDQLEQYGITIAISEDWDRQGRLTQGDGLTDFGKKVRDASDLLQLHRKRFRVWQRAPAHARPTAMPYYHCDQVCLRFVRSIASDTQLQYPTADNVMDYFSW